MQSNKTKEQRVETAVGENGEDTCFDDPEKEEALPEADSPASNTRSGLGSNQQLVTHDVLMTILDISGTGVKLTVRSTTSRKSPTYFLQIRKHSIR